MYRQNLSNENLDGFVIANADNIHSAVGKVVGNIVGMLTTIGASDVTTHKVVNVNRLAVVALDCDAKLLGGDNKATRATDLVDTHRRMELRNEERVLSESNCARIVSDAVTPLNENIASVRESMDMDDIIHEIETAARDTAEIFIIGDDTSIDMDRIDRATNKLDVVAEEMAGVSSFDRIHISGIGVIGIGMIDDGLAVVGAVGEELLTGTAGSTRIVVDSDNEVVDAIEGEWFVENDIVPTLREMKRTFIDLGELVDRNQIKRVVKMRLGSVGQVDSAVLFGEVGIVVVAETDGADVLSAAHL